MKLLKKNIYIYKGVMDCIKFIIYRELYEMGINFHSKYDKQ